MKFKTKAWKKQFLGVNKNVPPNEHENNGGQFYSPGGNVTRKIMIVDDDPVITKMIHRFLESHSYNVISSNDGSEALMLAKECRPDLVLTDATMPGLDGHSLCRALRTQTSTKHVPLILMSGNQTQEPNILAGFERGADDYLIKPLSMPLLLARIEAVLRRTASQRPPGQVQHGDLELDPAGRTVKVGGQRVNLTRKEFDLLSELLNKSGRVLSVPYLLETIWGYDPADYNSSSTIEAHISHLRKKCGPRIAKMIVNVTGYGYKFDDLAVEETA